MPEASQPTAADVIEAARKRWPESDLILLRAIGLMQDYKHLSKPFASPEFAFRLAYSPDAETLSAPTLRELLEKVEGGGT